MAYSKPDMFEEGLVFLVCCTTEEEICVLGEACSGSKPFCRLDRRAEGVCWLPPERGLESGCVGAFRFRVFEGVDWWIVVEDSEVFVGTTAGD